MAQQITHEVERRDGRVVLQDLWVGDVNIVPGIYTAGGGKWALLCSTSTSCSGRQRDRLKLSPIFLCPLLYPVKLPWPLHMSSEIVLSCSPSFILLTPVPTCCLLKVIFFFLPRQERSLSPTEPNPAILYVQHMDLKSLVLQTKALYSAVSLHDPKFRLSALETISCKGDWLQLFTSTEDVQFITQDGKSHLRAPFKNTLMHAHALVV